MISVIVVYNDLSMLRENLLRSLEKQDVKYELILVDNTKNAFSSYTAAINYGGNRAHGEYLMFVHQDVELVGNNWLRKAEQYLDYLNDIGIAGVSGVDQRGNPVGFINDRGRLWGLPLKSPSPAMTLDEQLVIVPSKVFRRLKFDEGFKWHSWSADYCMQVQAIGLKVYVLPLFIFHNSPTLPILNVSPLERDNMRLWTKYGKLVQKTSGPVSGGFLFIYKLDRLIRIMKRMFMPLCYGSVIRKSWRLLDIVVPIEQPDITDLKSKECRSVGLSDKLQYLLASKKIKVHDDYILASLESMPFRDYSFDTINVSGVLEYMSKKEGERVLEEIERLGDKLVVKLPNNSSPVTWAFRTYKSRWHAEDLRERGYKVYSYGIHSSRFLVREITKNLPFIKWMPDKFSLFIVGIKEK
ncbi:MAG: glycosyltransferase [Candidatus Jordarchaeaceae archaeon]